MIPRYKAWDSWRKRMSVVDRIHIDTKGVRLYDDFGEYWRDFSDVELMQSTGLKDKNGKEIFEGDVIAIEVDDTETPINARVFQNSKIGVLMFHVFEDNEDVPMVELLEDNSVAFEIIGNIYENPELFEVE